MAIVSRLTDEIRTVDEKGTLLRVQEYQEFYITGSETDADEEIPGAVKYVTDDGMPCTLLPDGSFQVILDGRILKRIK